MRILVISLVEVNDKGEAYLHTFMWWIIKGGEGGLDGKKKQAEHSKVPPSSALLLPPGSNAYVSLVNRRSTGAADFSNGTCVT